jgi:NitT/TauT family transport system substrate-binding protein
MSMLRNIVLSTATVVGLGLVVSYPTSALTDPGLGGGGTGIQVKIMVKAEGLNKPHYAPITLASKLGFFKREGLNVKLVNEKEPVDADKELKEGRVQAVGGFYDKLISTLPNTDFKNVVTMSDTPGYVLLASKTVKDQFKTPADLKGHTIGVTAVGKIAHSLANQVVASSGNTPKDYTPVPIGGKLFDSMAQGKIDYGLFWGPEVVKTIDKGYGTIVADLISKNTTRQIFDGMFASTCVYMSAAYVKAHPDVAQHLANALVKTLTWMQKHTPEEVAAKLPAKYAGKDKNLYLKAIKLAMPQFTPDGRLPDGTAENMVRVLALSKPALKANGAKAAVTYTNKFVDKAKQTNTADASGPAS